MSNHTTFKSSPRGRERTLVYRAARRAKYAGGAA